MSSNASAPATLNMELLDRLRGASGQFVPLAALGGDRPRVWDDLVALERFGFQIERHPYLGAAYRGPTHRLCPDQIEHGLKTSTNRPTDRGLEPREQHQRPGRSGRFDAGQ